MSPTEIAATAVGDALKVFTAIRDEGPDGSQLRGGSNMNTYPEGSLVVCRFAFLTRPLTPAELVRFLAGSGLPSEIGVEPGEALLDFRAPGQPSKTLSGADVISDGGGEFHSILTGDTVGVWSYRGRGLDAKGEPLAATPDVAFAVTRTF
jgi:hypothetical protein